MSERTIQQLANRLNSSDPEFDDCTDAAIALLRQHAEIGRLTADRDAAIASAVAAEREECANACRKRAESAGLYGSASAGARQCEIDIRARSAT